MLWAQIIIYYLVIHLSTIFFRVCYTVLFKTSTGSYVQPYPKMFFVCHVILKYHVTVLTQDLDSFIYYIEIQRDPSQKNLFGVNYFNSLQKRRRFQFNICKPTSVIIFCFTWTLKHRLPWKKITYVVRNFGIYFNAVFLLHSNCLSLSTMFKMFLTKTLVQI